MASDLDKLNMKNLRKGLGMRARAKLLEDEASVIKKDANKLIEAAATMLDIKTFSKEGVGTVTVKQGTNRSISADRLKESLLTNSVDSAIIIKVLEESTKVTTYTTVEYKKTVPKAE